MTILSQLARPFVYVGTVIAPYLIENWKQAWRMYSVQVLVALAALPFAWAELPEDVKAMVPDHWTKWIMLLIALGGIIGRLKAQPKVEK